MNKKIFSAFCAFLLLITMMMSFLFPMVVQSAAPESSKLVLKPGLVDNMTYVNVSGQEGTAYGAITANNNVISLKESTSIFQGESFGMVDNYWSASQFSKAFAINPSNVDEIGTERSITYSVRPDTYLAFNVIISGSYLMPDIKEMLFNNNGKGFRLQTSSDNGNSWNVQTPVDVYKISAIKPLKPVLTLVDESLSGIVPNFVDFAKTSTASWSPLGAYEYGLAGYSVKIPVDSNLAKIVFPSDDYVKKIAGEYSVHLCSVKASKTLIDRNSKGDVIVGSYYEDPEVVSLNSNEVLMLGSKMVINNEILPTATLNDIKSRLKLTLGEIKFYNGNTEVPDLNTPVSDGLTAKLLSKGYGGLADGTVVYSYDITKGVYANPSITSQDNLFYQLGSRSLTVKSKTTDPVTTYKAVADHMNIIYGDVVFTDSANKAITNLDTKVTDGSKMILVTKNCPLQADGIIKGTYTITVILLPQYLETPDHISDPKLVLKPGVADWGRIITDPTEENWKFSAYVEPSEYSVFGLSNPTMSPNDSMYSWLANASKINKTESLNQYQYGGGVSPDAELFLEYSIVGGSNMGSVFLLNTEMPADTLVKCFDDIKFFTSADKKTWTEVTGSNRSFIGAIGPEGSQFLTTDIYTRMKELDGNGKGFNGDGGAWVQVLYNCKTPSSANYFRVKFPKADYIRVHDGVRDFTDDTKTTLNNNVKYTFCAEHWRWDSGTIQQGSVAPHSTLSHGGRIVSDMSMVWSTGFRLACVKASAPNAPFTKTSFGSYEYVNDYDKSAVSSKDKKKLTLTDDLNNPVLTYRAIDGASKTLGDIKASLNINFARVEFFKDDNTRPEDLITDMSVIAQDNMVIFAYNDKNKASDYFPDNEFLSAYYIKILDISSADLPKITSTDPNIVIDEKEKKIIFSYYADEEDDVAKYQSVIDAITATNGFVNVRTLNDSVITYDMFNKTITGNSAKLSLSTHETKGFDDDIVTDEYIITTNLLFKNFGISSNNEKLIQVDLPNKAISILAHDVTIKEFLYNTRTTNATVSFSRADSGGAFSAVSDESTVIDENIYIDVFSTVDGGFIPFTVLIDSKILPNISGVKSNSRNYIGFNVSWSYGKAGIRAAKLDGRLIAGDNVYVGTAGDHTIVVTDNLGNVITKSFVINEMPKLENITLKSAMLIGKIREELNNSQGILPNDTVVDLEVTISALEKRIFELTTAKNVEDLIASISTPVSFNNIAEVFSANYAYEQLSSLDKLLVNNTKKLTFMQNSISTLLQKKGNITLKNADWYVELRVSGKKKSDKAWEDIAKEMGDKKLVSLYDMSLMNTYENAPYSLENGKKVSLTITISSLNNLKNIKAIHQNVDKTLEYITPVITGNDLTIELSSMSLVGIIAEVEDSSPIIPTVIIVIAIAVLVLAGGVIILVFFKKRTSKKLSGAKQNKQQ